MPRVGATATRRTRDSTNAGRPGIQNCGYPWRRPTHRGRRLAARQRQQVMSRSSSNQPTATTPRRSWSSVSATGHRSRSGGSSRPAAQLPASPGSQPTSPPEGSRTTRRLTGVVGYRPLPPHSAPSIDAEMIASGPLESSHDLDVRGVGEQIEAFDALEHVARIDEPARVARNGGDVAGHVHDRPGVQPDCALQRLA
jgi:hypothetical protein